MNADHARALGCLASVVVVLAWGLVIAAVLTSGWPLALKLAGLAVAVLIGGGALVVFLALSAYGNAPREIPRSGPGEGSVTR